MCSLFPSKEPASVDHGDVFFIVSQRPGQNISYEPQAMMGYQLKPDSKVNVTIDKKSFVMFVKGRPRGSRMPPRSRPCCGDEDGLTA